MLQFCILKLFLVLFTQLYLQSKLNWTGSKLYKYMLEAAALYLALYVCLSRISDNRHHWNDVLGGGVLGALVALIVVGISVSQARVIEYKCNLIN